MKKAKNKKMSTDELLSETSKIMGKMRRAELRKEIKEVIEEELKEIRELSVKMNLILAYMGVECKKEKCGMISLSKKINLCETCIHEHPDCFYNEIYTVRTTDSTGGRRIVTECNGYAKEAISANALFLLRDADRRRK